MIARLANDGVDYIDTLTREPLGDILAEPLSLKRFGRGENLHPVIAVEHLGPPLKQRYQETARRGRPTLATTVLGAEGTTTLLAATTLGLTLLALTLHRRLLIEAAPLELFVDALVGDLTFEGLDGTLDVVTVDDDLEGAQDEFVLAQEATHFSWRPLLGGAEVSVWAPEGRPK